MYNSVPKKKKLIILTMISVHLKNKKYYIIIIFFNEQKVLYYWTNVQNIQYNYYIYTIFFFFELKINCSNSIICSLHLVKEKINKNTTQEVT